MARKRSHFRNLAELAVFRLLFVFIGLFPVRTSLSIGKAVGRLLGKVFRGPRRTARRNLELAFPEMSPEERERLIDRTFEALGRHLGMFSHLHRLTPQKARDMFGVEGAENVFKAQAAGKGILFFTGHFGGWEIFNLLVPAHGYKMHMLVRRLDNPLVERFVDRIRTRFGNETLDKMKSARRMYRVLQEGGYLGILADLNAQEREGIFVDFFGVPACSTTSVAKLALTTGVPLVPGFAVWKEEQGRYVAEFGPALEFEPTGDRDEDIRTVTELVAKALEATIRANPEQWMWTHKRWNTRPKGEKGIY